LDGGGAGYGNTDALLYGIAHHQSIAVIEPEFDAVFPVMFIRYQVMKAGDKPGDDACGHEVVGIMEMEIGGGAVRGDIDIAAFGLEEFGYDIIVGTDDIET